MGDLRISMTKFERGLLVAIAVVLAFLAVMLGANPRRGLDFQVYLTAASRFVDGAPLYVEGDGSMPFKYAPPAAVLFAPFLALPGRSAPGLWNLLSVTALLWSALAWSRRIEARNSAVSVLLALLVVGQPLYMELYYAQVDLMMLALLTVVVVAVSGGGGMAGLALATAVLFKPPALLLLVLVAQRRSWRALGWFLGASGLLWLPVLSRYGLHQTASLIHEWGALVERTTAPWMLGHNPQGLPTALLSPFFAPGEVPSSGAIVAGQVVAAASCAGAFALGRPREPGASALLVLGVALLSPLAWRANVVLAFPAALVALGRPRRSDWSILSTIAIVGALTRPELLGEGLFQRLMLLRPFAFSMVALGLLVLWRSRDARSGASSTTAAPATRRP